MTNRTHPRRRWPGHSRLRPWLDRLEDRRTPATYYVDDLGDPALANPNDPDRGTLRYVIDQANNNPGNDDIFIIKMGMIDLLSSLEITDSVTIDPYGASESIINFAGSEPAPLFVVDDCNDGTSMSVKFVGLTLMGGRNAKGGAIQVADEDIFLDGIVLANNTATAGPGGAIYFGTPGGKLTIRNSTLSGNKSAGPGGAIYIAGSANVLIQNSTISGNSAGGPGGAIAAPQWGVLGKFNLQNSTITANTANGEGGGLFFQTDGPVTVESSIITGNVSAIAPDLSVGTLNLYYSAIGASSKFTLGNNQGNLGFGINLLLGPLADNGGETQTHALATGSAAIDAGRNPADLVFDQRGPGFLRVINMKADIGAYEASPIPYAKSKRNDINVAGGTSGSATVTFVDNNAIDFTTITADDIIITQPNGLTITPSTVSVDLPSNGTPRTGTYTFTPPGGEWDAADNGTYTVSLKANVVFDADTVPNAVPARALGDFLVSIPLSAVVNATNDEIIDSDGKLSLREAILNNPGATITFDPAVFGTTQTIKLGLGEIPVTAPLTLVGPAAKVVIDAQSKNRALNIGGAAHLARVVVSNLTITNGFATNGGAVLNTGQDLWLRNCALINNTADISGGGIAILGDGRLLLDGCSVENNHANMAHGGGVAVIGKASALVVRDSAIFSNSSSALGGGIYVADSDAPMVIANSTLSSNTALSGGGLAVLNSAGPVKFNNATIYQNVGSTAGGGIYMEKSASVLTLHSTIVAGNINTINADDIVFVAAPTNQVPGDNNLIGAVDPSISLTGVGNQTGTVAAPLDAKLAALANNGGPTLTHALLPGSPALDKGNTTVGGLIYDQRGPGFFRIRGGVADVGAFESQTLAPPKVAKVEVNGGLAQRSRVTTLSVEFDQVVTIAGPPATAFELTRQSDGLGVIMAAKVDVGVVTTVTLTFLSGAVDFGSLADGRFTLRVIGSRFSSPGGTLDGDGNGYVTNCDDFVEVGAPNLGARIYRLFGDNDGDGDADTSDFAAFRQQFGTTAAGLSFDFDNDNDVDASDLMQFRLRFGQFA